MRCSSVCPLCGLDISLINSSIMEGKLKSRVQVNIPYGFLGEIEWLTLALLSD